MNYKYKYLKYKKKYIELKKLEQSGGAKKRPSPSESATKFKVDTKKKGNDCNMWIIVENKNGVKRWSKISDTKKINDTCNTTIIIKSKKINKTIIKKGCFEIIKSNDKSHKNEIALLKIYINNEYSYFIQSEKSGNKVKTNFCDVSTKTEYGSFLCKFLDTIEIMDDNNKIKLDFKKKPKELVKYFKELF
jgi:hypothetical protein